MKKRKESEQKKKISTTRFELSGEVVRNYTNNYIESRK